jgi:hypothetical protein
VKWTPLAGAILLPMLAPAAGVRLSRVTERGASATVTFVTPQPLAPGAVFRGVFVLDGVEPGVPVSAPLDVHDRTATLPLEIDFAKVPPGLASKLRLDSFDYLLSGTAGDSPLAVSGGGRWEDLGREPGAAGAISRFIRLRSVSIEKISLTETRARGELEVRNPFSFDLKIASLEYRLFADRSRIADGRGRGLLLHKMTVSRVALPLDVDHAALLPAAGAALLSGGEIDGSLEGSLTLRLPAGDVRVPFALPGRISVL